MFSDNPNFINTINENTGTWIIYGSNCFVPYCDNIEDDNLMIELSAEGGI